MKVLTVYQPWASLIMIGAKPYEFRRWDFSLKPALAKLIGHRVVIHASARPIRSAEVEDVLKRIGDHISSLRREIAMPLLLRLRDAHKCRGVLSLGSGLGTAVIGKPKSVKALFNSPADSDRLDHHMFAWPLTDIHQWDEPVPMRGLQGFWDWPGEIK